MRIGAYIPHSLPYSVSAYLENLLPELRAAGCDISTFDRATLQPLDVDLLWDPRAGREGPPEAILNSNLPVAATFHGAVYMSIPLHECFGLYPWQYARGLFQKHRTIRQWKRCEGRRVWVIGVSEYAVEEFNGRIGAGVIGTSFAYHGADHSIFRPSESRRDGRYFFHVSSYQPKKNIHRIIRAFISFADASGSDMRLTIVSPGFPGITRDRRVTIINRPVAHKELAGCYQEATALLFPSLHETFGMPIVEAMASGCPVITSNDTACAEIGSDAAVLVDPRSESSIRDAMARISTDSSFRADMSGRGLRRAGQFTWKRSAMMHVEAFKGAMRDA